MPTRCRLADRCQNKPLSSPPRSKNGSTISSQVSLSTRDGGGRVEPALRQSSSQTARVSAITTSGGSTRTRSSPSRSEIRLASGGRFGASGRTFASVAGNGGAGCAFTSGMFIAWILPAADSSDFSALDGEALEVGARVVGIEHLAVEEGLLAARGRFRDLVGRHAEVLGGRPPDVLAVDLLDQRIGIDVGLELAPADILGDEPGVVALERVGRVVLPEFHELFGALLDAPVAVVDVA